MENMVNFEEIKKRFKDANVDDQIEIYTTTQGLTVEQFKELLRMFPLQHLDKLERAMAQLKTYFSDKDFFKIKKLGNCIVNYLVFLINS